MPKVQREDSNRVADQTIRMLDNQTWDHRQVSFREEFANRLSLLQESCKHEKTKWMNIEWAPGHVSGRGCVCLSCEKTLETTSEFEPNNPKLRDLLKRSKRLR